MRPLRVHSAARLAMTGGLGLGLRPRVAHLWACVEAAVAPMVGPAAPASITSRTGARCGHWFVSTDDPLGAAGAGLEATLLDAEACLAHRFGMLGTGDRQWGDRLDWHRDIVSGRVWPLRYHKRLRFDLSGVVGSDVKVPWELSRFQHLLPLIQAYIACREPRYGHAAIDLIKEWIADNPPCYGVNWTCAMEVAIRACNWFWARWALRGQPAWSDEFEEEFLRNLWHHGHYIETNLEDAGGVRTNHYLADIVGLLFIGIMVPDLPDAERWKELGRRELSSSMADMVYPDGMSFENSTGYHRLLLELFACSAILCARNSVVLPTKFWERLELMFGVIKDCCRPDGRIPMVGDADDGRLFPFTGVSSWDRWDFGYLLALGAVMFHRHDFKAAAGDSTLAVRWLLGKQGLRQWEAL